MGSFIQSQQQLAVIVVGADSFKLIRQYKLMNDLRFDATWEIFCERRFTAILARKYFPLFIDANAVNSARNYLNQSEYIQIMVWVHDDRDKSRPIVEVFIAINWITAGGRVMFCTFSQLYFHFKFSSDLIWGPLDLPHSLHHSDHACRCAGRTFSPTFCTCLNIQPLVSFEKCHGGMRKQILCIDACPIVYFVGKGQNFMRL